MVSGVERGSHKTTEERGEHTNGTKRVDGSQGVHVVLNYDMDLVLYENVSQRRNRRDQCVNSYGGRRTTMGLPRGSGRRISRDLLRSEVRVKVREGDVRRG